MEKIEQLANEWTSWKDKADEEIKASGDASSETKKSLEFLEAKLNEINVKVERNALPTGTAPVFKDIGAQFIESKAYKDMIASGRFESAPFEVKEVISSQAASAGDIPVPLRVPGIITPPESPLRIRDLIAPGRTTTNAVEYVEETLFTNSAAETAESYESNLTSKPESAFRFDAKTASVKTVAHWVPAARQIIEDAPMLQSYVGDRLMYGLKLVEDSDLCDDIVDAADDFDTDLITDLGIESATRLDYIRAAILQARQSYYPVSGVVLNPQDWAAMELLKNTTENYIWVSVNDGGVARLWRVPVVESDAMTAGTFLVGAFKLGAQIWDRSGPSIRISEHHASYFIQNMIAILAEERYALTIYRPEAFVTGSFPGTGSGS
jgi:HK97 family phage major capsid protein